MRYIGNERGQKIRVKIERREAGLFFLKHFRDFNLVPPFSFVNHTLCSLHTQIYFDEIILSLIHHKIHRTRFYLDNLSSFSFKNHLKLAATIRQDLWATINASTVVKVDKEGHLTCEKQNEKINKLKVRCLGYRYSNAESWKSKYNMTTIPNTRTQIILIDSQTS